MKKMKWKNEKRYHVLKTENIRVVVMNQHINDPKAWIVNVRELGWNIKRLGIPDESTPEEAKKAAIQMVKDYLNKIIQDLENA